MKVSTISKTTNKSRSLEQASMQGVFRYIIRGGVLLNIVLGFVYLLMLNSLSTRGFALEQLKSDKVRIHKEIEEIDIALAIPTSLYALESNEQVQAMADIGVKIFVEVLDNGQVAMTEKYLPNINLFAPRVDKSLKINTEIFF